jgi:hypothetical protein
VRRIAPLAAVCLSLAISGGIAQGRHRPRKSPHEEIVAVARVATPPRRSTHGNGREFEEFDVVILSARLPAGDGPADVNRTGSVHVVHDLTCGGTWLGLAPGDRIELKGEYVHPPDGRDLIHFTHPSDGPCGSGRPHAGGWIHRTTDPAGPGRSPTSF